MDLNYRIRCRDCKDQIPDLVEDFASGDLICRRCGCIVGDRIIDTRSEWRSFANDGNDNSDPSRVGGPLNPLLEGSQLDTAIGVDKGSSSKSKDLQKTQSRGAMRSAEKNLMAAYREIGHCCDRMTLTRQISDHAKEFYKIADAAKITKKNNLALIAACIYTACRAGNNPRTFKEICASTGAPKKEIGRCYKQLVPLIRDQQQLRTMSSDDFIARPCSQLGLPSEMQRLAVDIVKRASEIGCNAGKSPLTITAACIYLITLLFPKYANLQKDISLVAGCSESTFRNAYREMYSFRSEIIPLRLGITADQIENLPA